MYAAGSPEYGRILPLRGRTGLSACIFFACGKKGYRFNPLRVSGACGL
jgi:hypothetical protein